MLKIRVSLAVVVAPLLLIVGSTTACVRKDAPTGTSGTAVATELPILAELTDFSLIERDGMPVTSASLRGKVVLMNFIFTSCSGPCPLMSGNIKSLQTYFRGAPKVQLVSVSTDPATDTPAVLTTYAKRFEADGKRWLFLTGAKDEVVRVARDVLKLPAGEDPGMHSARFVVLDEAGRVRSYRDSEDPDFQATIRQDVERLLAANTSHH